MESVFLFTAALGGIVLVLQIALSLLGMDGASVGDADLDAGHSEFAEGLDLLSVRAVAAGATFFGLAGLWALQNGLSPLIALPAGTVTGLAAAAGTALLMRQMMRLEDDGTVRMEGAVGQTGSVYLRIPGDGATPGKIHFTLQGRLVECQAVAREPLAAGASILVIDVVGPDVVEVVPSPQLGVSDAV